ncbi:DM13 domain-containing protein [Akkermansiaceae bacterium]|nr:DM13 domain-containing protein [Akkermansiaceae bacterium]
MKNIIKNTFTALFALAALTGFSQAGTLKSGSWTKKEHSMAGTWKITEEAGTMKLIITDLKTKKAPDLKIYFSPKTVGSVTAKTATEGSFFLKQLSSHKGSQTYTLPAGFDLSKYKSVLVHCKKYTKLWGGGNL